MIDLRKLVKRLIFLPIWAIVLLIVASTAALCLSMILLGTEHPVSYASYVLSAYTLTVICFRIPQIVNWCKKIRRENRYLNRLTTDVHFQATLSLYFSLGFNTVYALFQLVMGIYHSSIWFFSLAVYYILLVIMRFFLARDVKTVKNEHNLKNEYLRYRFCGIILVLMNMALAGIVLYISRFNYGFEHHYITTIALAAYTFTAFTVAIVNIVRYRKYNSPVYSASKIISLAAACVSMLTLETAMLSAFGEQGEELFRRIITTVTGAAVCTFVLLLAGYMIISSTKALNNIKENERK